MTVYFQADAGHPDFDARRAARSTSTRWSAPTPTRCSTWADKLTRQLRRDAGAARRRLRGAGRRPARACQCRPRAGRPARRLDAERQRHAQRRLRPAADFHHLRPGQPVPRHPGSAAALPAATRRALSKLYVTGASTSTGTAATVANTATGTHQYQHHRDAQRGHRLEPGAAGRLRALRAHHGAAGDRAPGAVPLGHHQLRSRARLRADATRSPPSARRSSDDRHAGFGDRQLFRRRRRIRQVAGRRALADPRRRDRPSTSCSACCTRASSTRSRSCRRCPRPASARCWR